MKCYWCNYYKNGDCVNIACGKSKKCCYQCTIPSDGCHVRAEIMAIDDTMQDKIEARKNRQVQ